MRRLCDQQLNFKMQVRNRTKVPFEHLAITCQAYAFAIVANILPDKLFQVRPILLVQACNVVSIDTRKVIFRH